MFYKIIAQNEKMHMDASKSKWQCKCDTDKT